MIIYYLYVKTHRITKLQYLGYTSKSDPYKYAGSGVRWNNHLRKHGYLYDTKILHRCISKSAIKAWGIFYSRLWSVANSKKWANLKDENGDGGGCFGAANGMFRKTHTNKVKSLLGEKAIKQFKGKSYEELYGKEKADKLKKLRSENLKNKDNSYKKNPRFDNNTYTFFNLKTGEIMCCTRWILIHYFMVNKTGVSDMINKGITYKDWCVLYS
jgi:hypothetical protein